MGNIELTTMCAVIDKKSEKVLLINRKKNWEGYAFPGGHLENGESFNECIIREIKEETGLRLNKVIQVGVTHFYNTENMDRLFILNYVAYDFEGVTNSECEEGMLEWVKIEDVFKLPLAEGMEQRLDLFFEDGYKEMYVEWNEKDGYTKMEKNKTVGA